MQPSQQKLLYNSGFCLFVCVCFLKDVDIDFKPRVVRKKALRKTPESKGVTLSKRKGQLVRHVPDS